MNIELYHGNILDIEADVLVCSANVSLNLTGGVGAEIVMRYGNEMQSELHEQIYMRSPRFAKAGEVFVCHTESLPYKVVLHAVAVDPLYHSTIELITKTVEESLKIAQKHGAKSVALTCLASGFGDLSLVDFVEGIKPLLKYSWSPIETLSLAQIEEYRFKELQEAFAGVGFCDGEKIR